MKISSDQYYVVHESILPDALRKTVQVKQLLHKGQAKTVHEAVEQVGLSRSSFYKYKDHIYPFNEIRKEKIVTISMDLHDRSGILSSMLALVAAKNGNVLTINQTIPLQEIANVVISVEIDPSNHAINDLLEQLRQLDGVYNVRVIGQQAGVSE